MEKTENTLGIQFLLLLLQVSAAAIVLFFWANEAGIFQLGPVEGFFEAPSTLLSKIESMPIVWKKKLFLGSLLLLPICSLAITFFQEEGSIGFIAACISLLALLYFYLPILLPFGVILQLVSAYLYQDIPSLETKFSLPDMPKQQWLLPMLIFSIFVGWVMQEVYWSLEASILHKIFLLAVFAFYWQKKMRRHGGNVLLGALMVFLACLSFYHFESFQGMLSEMAVLVYQTLTWSFLFLGTMAIFNEHHPKRKIRFKKHGRSSDKKTLSIPFVKGGYLNIVDWCNHVLLVGGSGFGKTTVLKQIAFSFIRNKRCGIIVDYKRHDIAEVAHAAYKRKRHKDYDFYHLSFHAPEKSLGCNPLLEIQSMVEAKLIAQVLHKNLSRQDGKGNGYFSDAAEGLLSGIIYFLRMEYPDRCSIPHLVRLVCHYELDSVLPLMAEHPDIQPMMSDIRSCLKHGAGEQASGTLGKLRSFLSKIDDRTTMYLFTKNDFTLDLNSSEKNGAVLAIGCNEDMQTVYAPLIATVVSIAMNKMRNRGGREWFLLFEELSKYIIPGLNHILTTVREGGGSIVAALQNSHTYALELGNAAEEFFQGFYNLIVMNSKGRTASAMSEIFGKEEKEDVSTTKQKDTDKVSTTSRKTERPRVLPSAFTDLEKGEVIASTQTKDGVRCLSQGKLKYLSHPTKGLSIPNDTLSFETELNACQARIIEEVESIIQDAKAFNASTSQVDTSKPSII